MTNEQLEAIWSKSENWPRGLYYYAPEDPRTVVPKTYRWAGWTFNFARDDWGYHLFRAILIAVSPILLVLGCSVACRVPLPLATAGTVLALAFSISLLCYEARREASLEGAWNRTES